MSALDLLRSTEPDLDDCANCGASPSLQFTGSFQRPQVWCPKCSTTGPHFLEDDEHAVARRWNALQRTLRAGEDALDALLQRRSS